MTIISVGQLLNPNSTLNLCIVNWFILLLHFLYLLIVSIYRDGRVMGVLEVSRSIGDGQYKKLGVTCVPEVRKCQIQDTDRYKNYVNHH